MGGDLNGKKSFHPSKWRNQAKVFQAEEAAREEKKKISQIQREREEERFQEHLKELQQSHQITSEKPAVDPKLSWMYQGPLESTAVLDESRVAYLLGKRRVDKLNLRPSQALTEDEADDLKRAASTSTVAKDTSSKVLQDPLPAIRKVRHQQEREQAKKERIAHKSLSRRSRRDDFERGRHRRVRDSRPRSCSPVRETISKHSRHPRHSHSRPRRSSSSPQRFDYRISQQNHRWDHRHHDP